MSDTKQIVALWKRARLLDQPVYLATVVHIQGSSYRKVGARMLITSGGEQAGGISGGCLEAEISRKIAWNTRNGAAIQSYQSSFDDDFDSVPYGLGCGGTVWVLMETGSQAAAVLDAVERANDQRVSSVIVSALRDQCGTAAVFGGDDLNVYARFENRQITNLHTDEVRSAVASKQCIAVSHGPSVGLPEFLCMPVLPPARLLVFGAGDDAKPLVRFGAELGWHVHIADGRSHLVRHDRFPQATAVKVLSFRKDLRDSRSNEQLLTPLNAQPDDLAVILTHSYEQDRALLKELLLQPLKYLGILGPLHRTKRLLASIVPALGVSEDECLARLHAPVGLDIGTGDPTTIALSIVAEMQAKLAGKRVSIFYDL
ncbi:MAG: XdhC family protein [Edaphobacter sp.]|uniref:XdhC family protein n=1 Tax=Edaphobacter sp. TaxID=1934404 RepID=UPI00239F4CEF|nr:XdhC/CoxI family protein [Edaphobacter sp.]MDE1178060.1 XdhC family protein [Edaphobacter sp.]